MRDIKTYEEIKQLVDSFYQKVVSDDMIGYIFTEIQRVNWDYHLPRMYSFWQTVLFGDVSYKGNPMLEHFYVNKNEPLKAEYFQRWLFLWENTINDLFKGEVAEKAKYSAKNMAVGLQNTLKIPLH
jgi:hemoglobin